MNVVGGRLDAGVGFVVGVDFSMCMISVFPFHSGVFGLMFAIVTSSCKCDVA